MKNRNQQLGVTLVELLLVVVIVGMISTVAVPSFMKARDAAESTAAVANLRNMHTSQSMHKFQRGRYARLAELNTFAERSLGRTVGTTIRKGEFIYVMLPSPSDTSLRSGYQIIGYRIKNGRVVSQYQIQDDGAIRTVLP